MALSYLRTLTVLSLTLLSFTLLPSGVGAHPTQNYQNTDITQYHVPLSNGTASLPSPPSQLQLKAITLGRGTQNYTCPANSSAAPTAIGAIATIFDLKELIGLIAGAPADPIISKLPSYLINFSPENIKESPFIHAIGHHYFDGPSPVFDLGPIGFFIGVREAGIAAPPDASKGPWNQGEGAVDWLELCAIEGSRIIQRVYRVDTAGGKAPKSCSGQPSHFEVQYAANYWFFG
ncbi:hypothetical protein MMC31_007477 [Peltigera leucophlebia]|nr:hypothetical protein [Peltigera leucophlebia]